MADKETPPKTTGRQPAPKAAKKAGRAQRVLILIADAGQGHRSAAKALALALEELYGDACATTILNPLEDERAPAPLRSGQLDYDRLVREMPDVYKLGYEATDTAVPSAMMDGALTLMLFDLMRYVIERERPDVIVATHPMYLAALGAVFAVTQRRIPLITVVTDLATVHRVWFNAAADLCLVPTQAVRDLALEYGLPEQKVAVTGLPVNPRLAQPPALPAALRVELGWQPELTTVLAVGGKRVAHLAGALHVLNHSGLPLQLAVVAGGDDELYGRLKAVEWHVPAHVYDFVDNMPTLMQAADLVLGKAGGLIVTEALACGRPLILVDVIPGQETGNADYVVKGGAGELAASAEQLLEITYHWLMDGGTRLAQRAEHARRLGRPRAAFEAAELIWGAARSPAAVPATAPPSAPNLMDILRSLPNPGALFAGLTAKGKKKDAG